MVIIHSEAVKSKFKGTVIDIETTGEFCEHYQDDSRLYRELKPIIFGYIDKDKLKIHYIKNDEPARKLKTSVERVLDNLKKPCTLSIAVSNRAYCIIHGRQSLTLTEN